jgi:hypothetical protein
LGRAAAAQPATQPGEAERARSGELLFRRLHFSRVRADSPFLFHAAPQRCMSLCSSRAEQLRTRAVFHGGGALYFPPFRPARAG